MTIEPPLESAHPAVDMVPFPQIEDLPPLPPAPGEQPPARWRMRAAFIGQAIAALGALILLGSLFVGRWYHVRGIEVVLGARQVDDSYVGDTLRAYTNNYSLAVWAFLKRGYAIPVVILAIIAVVMTLLIVGRRRRRTVSLGLPFAVATGLLILMDLRHVPATVAEMATHFPSFPSDVHVHGLRPGLMMFVALSGLTLQIGGTLISLFCLPRVRRVRRVSRAQRQSEREQQPVYEFQPRGAREYAVQGAAALPTQPAEQRTHEGQRQERQHRPG
jgi:hypothetical protein